ncbi:MAG: hypothetical protein HQL32_09485 [Planctomycetes bacterium]|nr:hypothetical protein [Planctomycetota bacterium]
MSKGLPRHFEIFHINNWFKGWVCIGRMMWFAFVLSICIIPIRIISAQFDNPPDVSQTLLYILGLAGTLAMLIIVPYSAYIACQLTGRFTVPGHIIPVNPKHKAPKKQ